ncbi:MAG: lysozyme [Gluconacetobacter diazotrophicus]|nr:lysozyme [Gluconacetobacter diazotrophicus]
MDAMAVACAIGRRFEGCRLGAYPDPVSGGAPWTIGWGNTCLMDGSAVRAGVRLRDEAAADALQRHALELIRAKLGAMVEVELTAGEEGALLDFAFNLGSAALAGSTLLRELNAGNRNGAAAEFARWGHARVGGKLVAVPGLVRRRGFEAQVFLGRQDPTETARETGTGTDGAAGHAVSAADLNAAELGRLAAGAAAGAARA